MSFLDRLRRQPVPGDLACQQLVELVTDYLEGAMAPPDRERFDRHLGSCQGCQAYLEQMRATIRTMGRLSAETMDPHARDSLLHAFRDWRAG